MKWSFTLVLLLFVINAFAQQKIADKYWLDSLQKIARKNPESFSEKRQMGWINALIELGKYYETKQEIKKAIFYFDKLLDGEFYYFKNFFLSEKLSEECSKIQKRLSGYYFSGHDIKKDVDKSYDYALDAYSGNKTDYIQFSKRYFNSTAIILSKKDTIDPQNDSIFICTLNSFALKLNTSIKKTNAAALNDIANRFLNLHNDSLNFIQVTYFPPGCCKSDMCRVQNSLLEIKNYFQKNFHIPENKIITNMELGGGDSYTTFKGLRTPVIEIKFTENQPG
jgi:tetratricopeptide (TPR) repeat protein